MFRKQHKKEAVKKRRHATKKPYSRDIVGTILEVIQKKRSEKPEVRDAARETALLESKEMIKKTRKQRKPKWCRSKRPKPRVAVFLKVMDLSLEVVVGSVENFHCEFCSC